MSPREQAIRALNDGQTVFIPTPEKPLGQQFSLRGNPDYGVLSIADLPSEADFAMMTGDSEEKKAAESKIDAQIEALMQAKAKLTTADFSKKEEPKQESKSEVKAAEDKKPAKESNAK